MRRRSLKLGEPFRMRRPPVGEDERAYIRLRPRPAFVNVPQLLEISAIYAGHPATCGPYIRWDPSIHWEILSFEQAVRRGFIKVEDYE